MNFEEMDNCSPEKFYYNKGYAEGYGAAAEKSEQKIAWWHNIVEQLRNDNEELRCALQEYRNRECRY